jgi:hypothetical protein
MRGSQDADSVRASVADPSNLAVARGGHPPTFAGLSQLVRPRGDRFRDDRRYKRQSGEPRDVVLGEPFASRNLDQGLGTTGRHFLELASRASHCL